MNIRYMYCIKVGQEGEELFSCIGHVVNTFLFFFLINADSKEHILIAVLYQKCTIPSFLSHICYADYTRYSQDPSKCEQKLKVFVPSEGLVPYASDMQCVYMCTCVSTCMHVCVHVCLPVCMCVYMCVYLYECVCTCVSTCMYVCLFVCICYVHKLYAITYIMCT